MSGSVREMIVTKRPIWQAQIVFALIALPFPGSAGGLWASSLSQEAQEKLTVPAPPTMDRRITDALGVTQPAGPGLAINSISIGDPSGGLYSALQLTDGKLLLGRREWTHRVSYWLLVSRECNLERGIVAVEEGVAPLRPDQAQAELQRMLSFFATGGFRADAVAGAPGLANCIEPATGN